MEENEYLNFHLQRMEDNGLTDARKLSELEKDDYQAFHDSRQADIPKGQQISYGDIGWGRVVLDSIKKLPKDIFPYMKDQISAIKDFFVSPVQTSKGILDLWTGEGGLMQKRLDEKLGSLALGESKKLSDRQLKTALLFENEMYNIFGTEENFKKYVAENPTSVLTNVASLVTPTSKAAGLTKLSKISSYAEPINLFTLAAKTPITALMQLPKIRDLPVSMASRVVKLMSDMPEERRLRIVDTFLDNRSVATFGEVERISDQMEELNKIITSAIKEQDFAAIWFDPSKRMGVMNDLYKGLDELKQRTLENSSYGKNAADAIDSVKKSLMSADKELGRTDMIPTEVQARKVRFNKELSEAYQKAIQALEDTPIKNETKMVINRNMREFLEKVVPDVDIIAETKLTNDLLQKRFPGARALNIKELNRLEGDLAEIRHAIAQTVDKSRFGNLASWQLVTKMGAGSGIGLALSWLVGGDPSTFAKVGGGVGVAIGALDSSPYLKSSVSIYLKDLQAFGLSSSFNRPNAAMIRMGLYNADKISDLQDKILMNEGVAQ